MSMCSSERLTFITVTLRNNSDGSGDDVEDQVFISDEAKHSNITLNINGQSLEKRLSALWLHLVYNSSQPKLKRVCTFYSPKLLGYSPRHNSKLKGCADNTKVKH